MNEAEAQDRLDMALFYRRNGHKVFRWADDYLRPDLDPYLRRMHGAIMEDVVNPLLASLAREREEAGLLEEANRGLGLKVTELQRENEELRKDRDHQRTTAIDYMGRLARLSNPRHLLELQNRLRGYVSIEYETCSCAPLSRGITNSEIAQVVGVVEGWLDDILRVESDNTSEGGETS